jgi:hypothetical protein
MSTVHRLQRCQTPREFWAKHREASLNWMALGLLLGAWHAADNDAAKTVVDAPNLAKGHKTVNVL